MLIWYFIFVFLVTIQSSGTVTVSSFWICFAKFLDMFFKITLATSFYVNLFYYVLIEKDFHLNRIIRYKWTVRQTKFDQLKNNLGITNKDEIKWIKHEKNIKTKKIRKTEEGCKKYNRQLQKKTKKTTKLQKKNMS